MKLIALGDNCIDVYRNSDEMHPGGNAVNVAVHTARSGVDAEYLGAFADDFYAELLQKALERKYGRSELQPLDDELELSANRYIVKRYIQHSIR